MNPPTAAGGPEPGATGPRLIEVQRPEEAPTLTVRVGDVLLIRATGARLARRSRAVELWGPFVSGVATGVGVLTPAGPPDVVLVRARQRGSATLSIFTGDPWHAPQTATLTVSVES